MQRKGCIHEGAHAPAALGSLVVKQLDDDHLGEVLRSLFFHGDGFGCYQNFDAPAGAREWYLDEPLAFWHTLEHEDQEWVSFAAEHGQGYTWDIGGLTVDACWYWDGDGTLSFRVRYGDRVIRWITNGDCKKDYNWHSEL